MMFLLRKHSI